MREFFFFFKQKTAYEMRISDWSSDVCSSDLLWSLSSSSAPNWLLETTRLLRQLQSQCSISCKGSCATRASGMPLRCLDRPRSDERRVGKECVSTCRSRWSPYH